MAQNYDHITRIHTKHTEQKNEVFHLRFLHEMWPNPQFPADLVTFTEQILNGKLHFLVQCK